ncbi:hypothetical protein PFISCL1PPCAC_12410, partial [Pristionchus fissidentatus]
VKRRFIIKPNKENNLDLVESNNIDRLNEVLAGGDSLLESVGRDLIVLNNAADLELLDSESDREDLSGSPDKSVHLDGADVLLNLGDIDGVIPRLHIEDDVGLGDGSGLLGLLRGVLSQTISDNLGLENILRVGSEEVNVLIVVSGGGSSGGGSSGPLRAYLLVVRGDVLVPAGDVGELAGGGGSLERLKEDRVLTGDGESVGERLGGERVVEGLEAGVVGQIERHR